MFYRCSSLLSIPYFSKWNINNEYDMNSFLEDFSSIISLPNLFNRKVENKSIINIVKHIIIPLRFSRFANFGGRGDYCGIKLGYFRVVRIKIKQAFFEIFGWME